MSVRLSEFKLWPHMTVLFLVFAALGGVAGSLWVRHEPKAEALTMPRAARVQRVDGEAGLTRGLEAEGADEQWVELTPNTPLTDGDRLYVRDDSRASIDFTGRNFARLDPDSALDVVSLTDRRTQLALRSGSAVFDIGALAPGELFEVATPYGAVDLQQPGLYEVGYNEDGSAFVSVLSGLAQVVGLAGSGQISKGEMLTLLGQTAAQIALSRISPDYAGGLLDDYYGYQYPNLYDGRYGDYDAYLNDPDYYDPYNRYDSYRYLPASVPGAYDLDHYGDWQSLDGYGHAWSPRVETGWAPYQQGYWTMDDPYGLTWVSSEPWGYAPYHYGRWVNSDNRWFWVPEGVNAQPAYAPALVAFLPLTEANQIGWVPLGPGDPYTHTYYDADWQPHYLDGARAVPERVLNLGVPSALTVVSAEDFKRHIDRDALARFDPRMIDSTRPVLDPLSVVALRQASLENAVERRGFVLPPGLAKRLDATPVYASAPPAAPRFKERRARAIGLEVVPEGRKREKLQLKDERQSVVAGVPGGEKDERSLRRQERRQERRQNQAIARGDSRPTRQQEAGRLRGPSPRAEVERPARAVELRAQGERVGLTRQAQREAERQQARAAQQQQRVLLRQQTEAHRQAQHQAARQQDAARRAHRQQEMTRAQQPQQRRRFEQQQARPQPSGHASPGQMRKREAPAHHSPRQAQGPPQHSKPQGQDRRGGGGKGKGRP